MEQNYLDQLNPQQREAVEYIDGPSLVIAGAGSGKTRVLTFKVLHLLRSGIRPSNILALTFTNKAAREMKQRIAQVAGDADASRIWMGTFHSVFLRILRTHHDLIGFPASFTIYDTKDSLSLVKMIVKDMMLDEKNYNPTSLHNRISRLKNNLVTPQMYREDRDYRLQDENAGRPEFAYIYETYMNRCKLAGAMDFDDILLLTNQLLRDREDVRLHYQRQFEFVLVDEYQDTNFAQHMIVRQLTESRNRLCVVGDDAQSIYSFRGANIGNILDMERHYPGLKTFRLERNYRSTQNIVNAASGLISHNKRQLEKHVYSENEPGEKVLVRRTDSGIEEARIISKRISELRNRFHSAYDQFAVLYRTNAQSRQIEEALRNDGIPFRIYGGLAFFARAEVKDALAYFRLAVNPDDDEALRRVINVPARGIGLTTMKKVIGCALDLQKSIWWVITHPLEAKLDVNKGTLTKLKGFVDLVLTFHKMHTDGRNALDVAQTIYNRARLKSSLESDRAPENISKLENLDELLTSVSQFVNSDETESPDMVSYLNAVSLKTDQDSDDDQEQSRVTLMTIHAAKGLEFPHVIIAGLEEHLFPSSMSQSPMEIEEERRLFYVAITRAMTTCTITYAATRMLRGAFEQQLPSRFLQELDPSFVTGLSGFSRTPRYSEPVARPRNYTTPTPVQSFTPPPVVEARGDESSHSASELSVGQKIYHNKFGEGEILSIAAGPNATVMVQFHDQGVKKLMLKFAKFSIL